MKVGIIGSGGREHAICLAVKSSKIIDKIYCFPGNAGTAKIAKNVNIDLNNFKKIKDYILSENINLIIVGPEKPLVEGLVDYLENFNIKVFGPSKKASQLEGSKIFTKKFCKKNSIPTADFSIISKSSQIEKVISKYKYPLVVKVDGLAAGKGVYICKNKNQSLDAIEEIFSGKFGNVKNILLEEFLEGEEMSFFIVSDGRNYIKFGTAQDHKRALENDKGKNTGGMGAYSPSRLDNKRLERKIINKIINPTLKGLNKMGIVYKGFLYAGLMIVDGEPFLIEYNVRMGDPECQTILPKLKTSFLTIVNNCVHNKLRNYKIQWHKDKSLCIVLCSKGYPEKFLNHKMIDLMKVKLKKNEYMFHAGTKLVNEKIISNGGRVLNIVVKSKNFKSARQRAIYILKKINWKNGYYRKDIGYKVIS
jgi:phosphoribosylamine--glycine ligase